MTLMWDMIPPATRVYSYILFHLPIRKTEMYFDLDEMIEFTRYKSTTSIWKGIKWLIDNDFIEKGHKPGWFWLNPTLFFNGDRAIFVDTIVREGTDSLLPFEKKLDNPDLHIVKKVE